MDTPAKPLDLIEEARRLDPDRWLCALFVPQPAREAVMALIVLNQELARIPDLVSQPMIGAIRFQWWRDAIAATAEGAGPGHPVLAALGPSLARRLIEPDELAALADAREARLDGLQPQNLDDLETYVGATAGAVQALTARLIGCETGDIALARRAGTAFGLIGIVRATADEARPDRSLLPQELLGDTTSGRDRATRDALQPVLRQIVERAESLVGVPRRCSRPVCPALLPAVLARIYGSAIRRGGFAPDRAATLRRAPGAPLRLWWAQRTGWI